MLALIDAGRIEELRHELDRMGANLPAQVRADALITMGQPAEALKVFRQSEAPAAGHSEIDFADSAAVYSVVYARLGQRQEAERMVAVAIAAARNPKGISHLHHAQFHIGCTLALLGRPEEAMQWLTKAANEGYPCIRGSPPTRASRRCEVTPVSWNCLRDCGRRGTAGTSCD